MEKISMLIHILNVFGWEEVQIKDQNVNFESGLCNPDLVYWTMNSSYWFVVYTVLDAFSTSLILS